MANIIGDEGPNVLPGTGDADTISGLGGDDHIEGAGGADIATGGEGNDIVGGGSGDDQLSGGSGDDALNGGAGVDTLSFADLLVANAGPGFTAFVSDQFSYYRGGHGQYGVIVDLMNSAVQDTGQGWDTLTGIENVTGTGFADEIRGSAAANTILGGGGQDDLYGGGGADVLQGGADGDYLDGAGGFLNGGGDLVVDQLSGGDGDDLIVAGLGDIVDGGDGLDLIVVSFWGRASGLWFIGDEIDVFDDVLGAGGVQAANVDSWGIAGSQHNDWVVGDAAFNQIWGLDGNDRLSGHVGEDYLYGGNGDDTLESNGAVGFRWEVWGEDFGILDGGDGADTLYGGGDTDIIYTGGEDGDIDRAYGDDGNDYIEAASGDYADGGAGGDTLTVTLASLAAGVTIDHATAGNLNVFYSGLIGGHFTNFEGFEVFGTAYDDVFNTGAAGGSFWGEGGADTLTGGAAADFLSGGAGNDVVNGMGGGDNLSDGEGTDQLYGGDGADTLNAYTGPVLGNDTYDGGAGSDLLSFGNGEIGDLTINLALTGAQNIGPVTVTLVSIESVTGGQGDDTFAGTGQANGLTGGSGDDILRGLGGADTLRGDSGDDLLVGGVGFDTLQGGEGFDLIDYAFTNATQAVVIDLAANTVANDGYGATDTLSSIEGVSGGTRFADTLNGNSEANLLVGSIGDSLYGNGGDDRFRIDSATAVLDGGAGDDTIEAFFSTRIIDANNNGVGDFESTTSGVEIDLSAGLIVDDGWGGSGAIASIEHANGSVYDDVIRGSAGANILGGLAGDDSLDGGAGVDGFHGHDGFDVVAFGALNATQGVVADLSTGIIANDGFGNAETMVGIEGLGGGTRFVDTWRGDDGGNSFEVGGGDSAWGYGGDDLFRVGDAPALIDGGTGADTVTGFTRARLVDAGGGEAEWETTTSGVIVNLATQTILDDGFGGSGVIRGIENLAGSGGDDHLTGSSGDNVLWGGQGKDAVHGGRGADMLDGGQDDDILNGGAGDDSLDGGDGFDRASYYGAAAAVSVDLAILIAQDTGAATNWDTLISIEALEGTVYNDTLSGSGAAESFWGLNGVDTIDGRGGDDTIFGGVGNDVLTGSAGLDTLDGGDGGDTLNGGEDGDVLNGGGGNDLLDGGAGVDEIHGGDGGDTAHGGDGDDDMDGGGGADTLNGGAGLDVLQGGDGNDTLNGDADADELDGDLGNDVLNGGDGDDTLSGHQGYDALNGGDGEDLLYGGLERDTLTGGAGNDTFVYYSVQESTAGLRDIVVDFSAGDTLDLSAIDADTITGGDQAFVLVAQLTGVAGQLILKPSGPNTLLLADVDGDGVADFGIQLNGAHTTTTGFLL